VAQTTPSTCLLRPDNKREPDQKVQVTYMTDRKKINGAGAPFAWQRYELLHSFLGAYRIHNMEENTLENESMSPHLYFWFKMI